MPNCWRMLRSALALVVETPLMYRVVQPRRSAPLRRTFPWFAALASAFLLAGCSGGISLGDVFSSNSPSTPTQASNSIGTGQVKVGLILPLSARGNAAVAAQSMRNAAELALAEFSNPDIQLLVKDD